RIAELQADDRDDRQERVAQRMPVDHDALALPFGAGGAHIILLQHLEQGPPRQAAQEGPVEERQRARRQAQVPDAVEYRAQVSARYTGQEESAAAEGRQPVQFDGEAQDEQDADPDDEQGY